MNIKTPADAIAWLKTVRHFNCDSVINIIEAALAREAQLRTDKLDDDNTFNAVVEKMQRTEAALREENKLLRHDITSYLETTAKVCDLLSVDINSAKNAQGRPSDVLFAHVQALQQRLTVAEQRAVKFEGLLLQTNELLYQIQGDPGAVPSSSVDAMRGEVFTALKPGEEGEGS